MWILYFIQSENLCVLISKFNLLTLIEIIDIYYFYHAFKFSFFFFSFSLLLFFFCLGLSKFSLICSFRSNLKPMFKKNKKIKKKTYVLKWLPLKF